MSADTTDRRSNTELRQMDEAEAKRKLTVVEYERWETLNQHLDDAERVRDEWKEIEQGGTDILVAADMSNLACEIDLFGNDVTAYYDPEDHRVRSVIEDLESALDIDIDSPDDVEADADDIDEGDIPVVKDALADFIGVTLETWNGHQWDELSVAERKSIKAQLKEPRPDGWGLVGLMDALNEVIVTVEGKRDERLDRIQKFQQSERRGNR